MRVCCVFSLIFLIFFGLACSGRDQKAEENAFAVREMAGSNGEFHEVFAKSSGMVLVRFSGTSAEVPSGNIVVWPQSEFEVSTSNVLEPAGRKNSTFIGPVEKPPFFHLLKQQKDGSPTRSTIYSIHAARAEAMALVDINSDGHVDYFHDGKADKKWFSSEANWKAGTVLNPEALAREWEVQLSAPSSATLKWESDKWVRSDLP